MDATRIDRIAKHFADRRLSRRRVLRRGGAGIAAGALATGSVRQATAQDAAPAETETPGQTKRFLFVQSFQSGSVTPKEGVEGTFTLTLEQELGQTIYFSDRPERIVGATPTARFLGSLGFSPDNPPNAALVAEVGPGDEVIAVVELFDPAYDEAARRLAYDARPLQDWENRLDVGFDEAPADLAQLAPRFGAAHLFIDDCPDGDITCEANGLQHGRISNDEHCGYCYNWGAGNCYPCCPNKDSYEESVVYWTNVCNQRFAGCGGKCFARHVCGGGFLCPDQ
jgi:hypothetical protein